NPAANKIYVANQGSANVTVIDGANNTTVTVAAWTGPGAVAVNPVTHKIYVANQSSGNVTVITQAAANANAMATAISAGAGVRAPDGEVSAAFTAGTSLTDTPGASRQVYYQLDTLQGPWQLAAGG